MNRIPEPELMEEAEQARAYACADFSEPHDRFVSLFEETFGNKYICGHVLDLGCGPGDIIIRFARRFPRCIIHGIDGARAMLECAHELLNAAADVKDRISFIYGLLPGIRPPQERYDIIISNSLLHHLPDPQVLWSAVKKYSAKSAPVFVMDLMRPESQELARQMVETYSGNEPEVLKQDFFNSLLAAYEVNEVREQLAAAGLGHLDVRAISDRHLVVSGRI